MVWSVCYAEPKDDDNCIMHSVMSEISEIKIDGTCEKYLVGWRSKVCPERMNRLERRKSKRNNWQMSSIPGAWPQWFLGGSLHSLTGITWNDSKMGWLNHVCVE